MKKRIVTTALTGLLSLSSCLYALADNSASNTATGTTVSAQPATVDASKGEVIHLNSADAETLERIHGVGKVLAGRIIDYRKEKGDFKSVDDLANVKGFSEKKVARLKQGNPNLTI